jgi:hypothetical protein
MDGDPGVVDQDIQPAVARLGGLHSALPILRLRHIQMHIDRFAALHTDLFLDVFAVVIQDVAQHDLGAFLCE